MKNGAGWGENLALWTFSVRVAGNILFSPLAASKILPSLILINYSRWKPRKTVIRVCVVETICWIESFRRYCTIFSDFFKKRPRRLGGNKETKKRGNGANTWNIFGKGVKIRKYTFKLFWPSDNSLDKYFWHSCQKVSERWLPSIIQIYRYVSFKRLSHLTNVNLA